MQALLQPHVARDLLLHFVGATEALSRSTMMRLCEELLHYRLRVSNHVALPCLGSSEFDACTTHLNMNRQRTRHVYIHTQAYSTHIQHSRNSRTYVSTKHKALSTCMHVFLGLILRNTPVSHRSLSFKPLTILHCCPTLTTLCISSIGPTVHARAFAVDAHPTHAASQRASQRSHDTVCPAFFL